MTTRRRRHPCRAGLDRLLDLAFPARCVGCGREGAPICPDCRPGLDVRRGAPAGLPIGMPAEIPAPLLQLEWCAPFTGMVRRALHQLKYAGERRLAEPLGSALAGRWAAVGRPVHLVVPVPIHAARLRERGYDQAELLATVAGRELGIPSVRALVRLRATTPQFSLGRTARAGNVREAFGPAPGMPAGFLHGARILLVDDVTTTGATLAACGTALLSAGAASVAAITVARER